MNPVEIVGRRLARMVGLTYDDKAEEAGRGVLREVIADGWRVVRTDPGTEPGERVIVLEEWPEPDRAMSGTPDKRWFRSTDNGRSWEPTDVSDRSPLSAIALDPDEVYDDGLGNLYYYSFDHGDPVPG